MAGLRRPAVEPERAQVETEAQPGRPFDLPPRRLRGRRNVAGTTPHRRHGRRWASNPSREAGSPGTSPGPQLRSRAPGRGWAGRARLRARHCSAGVSKMTATQGTPARFAALPPGSAPVPVEAEGVDHRRQPPGEPPLYNRFEQVKRIVTGAMSSSPEPTMRVAGRSRRRARGGSARPPRSTCRMPRGRRARRRRVMAAG